MGSVYEKYYQNVFSSTGTFLHVVSNKLHCSVKTMYKQLYNTVKLICHCKKGFFVFPTCIIAFQHFKNNTFLTGLNIKWFFPLTYTWITLTLCTRNQNLLRIFAYSDTPLAKLTSSWCCINTNTSRYNSYVYIPLMFCLSWLIVIVIQSKKTKYLSYNISSESHTTCICNRWVGPLTWSECLLCVGTTAASSGGSRHICSPLRDLWQLGGGAAPNSFQMKIKIFKSFVISPHINPIFLLIQNCNHFGVTWKVSRRCHF